MQTAQRIVNTLAFVTLFVSGIPALGMGGDTVSDTAPALAFAPGRITFNGVTYDIRKSIDSNGQERITYVIGGASVDQIAMRAFVAGQSPQVILPAAQQAIDNTGNDDDALDLVVILRDQPGGPISREVHARNAQRVMELTGQMQLASRAALQRPSMPPQQERQFQPAAPDQAAQNLRKQAAQQLDDLKRDAMKEIYQRASAAVVPTQQALSATIAQLGGQVRANIVSLNALGITLPANAVAQLAADPLVAYIDIDHPGEPELDIHQNSLGLVTGFWANGIDGGVHDCGVLDTGVQQSHPALSSHTFLSNMGVADTQTHGTGMAGILASTNATFRGMAFGLDVIAVALAGSITQSMPGMDYIVSTGEPENTNYSFGNGTANTTDYGTTDQFFDGVIDTYGFMVSKSTGNGGYNATNPTITHPAPAFNLMASANMNDFNTVARTDDRIDTTSSVGPTFGGRKKPDITSPGTNSMSCTPSGTFANIGGTSSASPHTGGGIILLYDMGVTNVMAGKAVLLNNTDAMTDSGTSSTADDAFVQGSLWNRRYGWGYLNLGSAYLHGLDVYIDSVPPSPETADFRLYVGQMFDKERATLTWQRHVAYNGAMFPTQIESLSDLDLRQPYRQSDNTLIASSASAIDNVEQFHVNENAVVVLKVEAFGSFDPQVPTEEFAVATQENFAAATGPAFGVQWTHPSTVSANQQFTIDAVVTNTGDVTAHASTATLSGVTIINGPNPASLPALAASQLAMVSWTVQAAGFNGSHPLSLLVQSNSYGEMFDDTGNSQYGVGVCVEDITGNGTVDIDDLLAVINAWGPCAPPCPPDVNNNGTVDIDDLLAVINAWGPCS